MVKKPTPAKKAVTPAKVKRVAPRPANKVAKKQTTSKVSKLASDVLANRKKPTAEEIRTLAASVLSQDETAGD